MTSLNITFRISGLFSNTFCAHSSILLIYPSIFSASVITLFETLGTIAIAIPAIIARKMINVSKRETDRAIIFRLRIFFSIGAECFSSVLTTALSPTDVFCSLRTTMFCSLGFCSLNLVNIFFSSHIISGLRIYAITIPQIIGAIIFPTQENVCLKLSNLNTNTTNNIETIITVSAYIATVVYFLFQFIFIIYFTPLIKSDLTFFTFIFYHFFAILSTFCNEY